METKEMNDYVEKIKSNIWKEKSISDGFYAEIEHLFLAMRGEPKIYPSFFMKEKEYKFSEENPGADRSNFLDAMYGNIEKFLNKYPSGLDNEVINKRKKNKEKILNFFGAGDDDWNDYGWHLRHLFRSMDDVENLKKLITLTDGEINAMEIAIKNKIPFCITPYYLHLMDFDNADRKYDHQIRAQVIPTLHYVENMLRHTKDREYKKDFMKERDTTPQKGITRRYVMISIIKPIQTCPQICVYCQRNWQIMNPDEGDVFLTSDELEKAIDWFSEHKSMREVLITGGDPFMMEDDAIEHIIK
ncbi:MAG: KamA family radical SAM protein, partial [Candidatus Altiarchaeales archaeon HGW-Altiarchaeales-1]